MDTPTAVIILPGWRVSSIRYNELSRHFKKAGYPVYVFDFAGFDDSKPLQKAMSLTDYAHDVDNFISEKKIKKAILIGHSFGGRVAIRLASNHPDWLVSLVLTGTPGFKPVNTFKRNIFLVLSKIGKVVFSLPLLNIFSPFSKKVLYRLSGSVDYLKVEGNLKKTFQSVIQEDLEPFMKKIDVPALLVWGERDTMVPFNIAKKMKQKISNSHFEIIPQSGHKIPFDNTDEFFSMSNSFIKKHI